MKTTIKILVIIAVLFSFTSCDKLTDVNFTTTITGRIPVHVDQGDAVTFDETTILNLDNEDTHDYLNSIKTIEVTSLKYKLINFSGDVHGTLDAQFYIESSSLVHNNITVKETVDNVIIFEINDTHELTTIAKALKNNQQVTARYVGSTNNTSDAMNFKADIVMEIAITADPI